MRYALILGLLGGLAASAVVEVDGATLLGHLRRGTIPPTIERFLVELPVRAERVWEQLARSRGDGQEPIDRGRGEDGPGKTRVRTTSDAQATSSRNAGERVDEGPGPADAVKEREALTSNLPKETVRRADLLREAVAKSSPKTEQSRREKAASPRAQGVAPVNSARPNEGRAKTTKRTRVDERITPTQKKALDALISPTRPPDHAPKRAPGPR